MNARIYYYKRLQWQEQVRTIGK